MVFTSKLIMLVTVFMIIGYILSVIGTNMAAGINNVNNALQAVWQNGHFLLAFFLSLAGAIKFADEIRRGELEATDIFYLTLAIGGAIFIYGSTCSPVPGQSTGLRASCPWFQTAYSMSSVAGINIPILTDVQATVFGYIWAITTIALGIAFGLRLEKKIPKIF